MKKKGRKELLIRRVHSDWLVGYWDRDTGDPGRDFRSFGSRRSEEEAIKLRKTVLERHPGWFYHC